MIKYLTVKLLGIAKNRKKLFLHFRERERENGILWKKYPQHFLLKATFARFPTVTNWQLGQGSGWTSGGTWSSLVIGEEGCIGPSRKLLCLWRTPKNYAANAWHYSIHVLLMCPSSCSYPSTKELHGCGILKTEVQGCQYQIVKLKQRTYLYLSTSSCWG